MQYVHPKTYYNIRTFFFSGNCPPESMEKNGITNLTKKVSCL